MDLTHINYYLLVYSGTVALGLLMLAIMALSFLAVASAVTVVYGLVAAARRIAGAALKARPVVSPAPAVLRHSSRTVVVHAPRTRPADGGTSTAGAGGHQPPLKRAA